LDTEQRETRKIVLGSHTGTHCDAPRHFIAGGLSVDQLPLEVLMGPARLVDFSDVRAFQEIDAAELEERIGVYCPERIVLRYDWSDNFGLQNYYSDHPFISENAAHWLVGKGVKLLAMDTPMPDNPKNGRGSPNDSPIHKIMLKNGVVLVEYLTNLRELKKKNFELIVLPLKLSGADGSPVRCVAVES
ncbi:MAG: cyclase family protein, partial [Deltaproteobacteria bacterium]|nr:cyclase family protein [Deltaproteobacteria bacterium]